MLKISADRMKRLNPSVSSVATVKPNNFKPSWSPVRILWTKTLRFRGFKWRNLRNRIYSYQTDLPVHLTKKKAFKKTRKIDAKRNIFGEKHELISPHKCEKHDRPSVFECFYILIRSRDCSNGFFVSIWSQLIVTFPQIVAIFPWKHVNEVLMIVIKWFIS
jgi:hypothetical protein